MAAKLALPLQTIGQFILCSFLCGAPHRSYLARTLHCIRVFQLIAADPGGTGELAKQSSIICEPVYFLQHNLFKEFPMKTTRQYGSAGKVLMLSVLMIVLGLVGCQKEDSDTAGKKVERSTENTAPTTSGQADRPAEKMEGVKEKPTVPKIESVKEQPIIPKTPDADVYIDDAEITEQVNEALLNDPILSDSNIEVTTSEGVVKLGGTVDSEQAMDRARELAGSQKGVKSVQTDLSVSATAPDK
jgi:hyperosmotically inducible protein